MHQPDIRAIAGGIPVEVDALQERTEAVPHSYDGNSNFVHFEKNTKISGEPGRGQGARLPIIEQMCGDAISGANFPDRAVRMRSCPRVIMGIVLIKPASRRDDTMDAP
jgi:hypothetical protein